MVYQKDKKHKEKKLFLVQKMGISSEAMRRKVEPLKAVKRNLKFCRTEKGKVRRANLLSFREFGVKPHGIKRIGLF